MKRNIVAIGGGRIMTPLLSKVQTLDIDSEIIRMSKRKRPTVLFIPTASGDNQEYTDAFHRLYGGHFRCKTDQLLLFHDRPSHSQIKQKILNADIIYVGGGNTLRMMKLWRKLGIDGLLNTARKNGTVLAGLSAGAICWFTAGNSDSRKFKNPEDKTLIRVRGLDFVQLLLCPHYDTERHRQLSLKWMMQKQKGVAIALENCSALQIVDDKYRIITSKQKKNAWRVYWFQGQFYREKLNKIDEYQPLHELISV